MARILILEPDTGRQASLRSRVQDEGHEALVLDTAQQAPSRIRSAAPDLVLLAEELDGGADGYEVAKTLSSAEGDRVPMLLCSTLPATAERIERALRAGCDGFLGKAEIGALGPILGRALARKAQVDQLGERQQALELENRRLRDEGAPREPGSEAGDGAADPAGPIMDQMTPEAVLIVDASGVVQHADRGARELFGARVQGRGLSAILPSSGLEAFVRDTRTERRRGFRFDLDGPRRRSLVASVTPLAPSASGQGAGMRVVSLYDGRRGAGPVGPSVALHHELASLLENARETYRPESWIGQSPLARGLRMAVGELVELRTVPVLIQGPRGTGKELLGRILHYSGRAKGPFLRLRCSALAPDHLERELFGSPEGARDDFAEDAGLCRLAGGGTLFLEEVGELPLELQHRLLDTIESGLQPGAFGPQTSVDTRWIVSSSDDLRSLVERERFLEPLYARLRTHELMTTALSTRPEDLLELVQHYLARYGSSKGIFTVSPEALQALQRYGWPGNVDELADCVEQACAKAHGSQIELDDLTRAVRSVGVGPTSASSLVGPLSSGSWPIGRPLGTAGVPVQRWEPRPWEITDSDPINLDHYQKKALLRALARCGGDKVAAAKLLNVGKSTFYRKLKRFGITEVPGVTPR